MAGVARILPLSRAWETIAGLSFAVISITFPFAMLRKYERLLQRAK